MGDMKWRTLLKELRRSAKQDRFSLVRMVRYALYDFTVARRTFSLER